MAKNGQSNRSLEERVRTLENNFKIGLGVCAVLGISAGWIGKTTSEAFDTATKANTLAQTAKDDVEEVRAEAITEVNKTAASAVQNELKQQMPGAVDSRFDELVGALEVSLGAQDYKGYQKLDHTFTHKCDEAVLTQWTYGRDNNDISAMCNKLVVKRKPK